ncbi:hypothetical protein ACHAW5_001695 [Stephanodiscus triporus]|uniref:PH domain-containing protein n=1 Tax=Stephanodiscus triporus TaxID=2934178 RepID=A0ABD3Q8P6_9STRA
MTENTKDEEPPIILEEIVWKQRGGFGKYSTTVGAGPSWERRRIALTAKKLSYYAKVSKSVTDGSPRGTLDILPERATITATYPGDSSQPTPYAIAIKTVDVISQSDVTKWKICFDDRETQLLWLVALTDIVADASVREYNGKVLSASAEKTKYEPGGFHRLYEEGDGRLLGLVHGALLSSGKLPGNQHTRVDGEEIELVQRSTKEIHVMNGSKIFANTKLSPMRIGEGEIEFSTPKKVHVMDDGDGKIFTSSVGEFTECTDTSNTCNDDEQWGRRMIHDEKAYQALAVVIASLMFEEVANLSSSQLWKTVTFIILFIFFTSQAKKKSKRVNEPGETQRTAASSTKNVNSIGETVDFSSSTLMTKSMVGTELMKFERVPLSEEPSERFEDQKTRAVDDESRLHRPLTLDEMRAHAHERWAMSAPNVDLSGEWTLIADDAFKQEYDAYLKQLGFSGITRKVACSLISRTAEITKQSDNGRKLFLKGINPKGEWERLLTASGYPDFDTDSKDSSHVKTSIKTADAEDVDAEAWWEELGTKHRSWLRGGKKYGGGDFESLRYLEEGSNGSVLVCVSTFHPNDASKEKAVVTWRFKRD